jgi:hypothetical protein
LDNDVDFGLRTDRQIDWRHSHFQDAMRVMIIICLAISMFALTLLGLAFSLSSAQSQQDNRPEAAIVIHR